MLKVWQAVRRMVVIDDSLRGLEVSDTKRFGNTSTSNQIAKTKTILSTYTLAIIISTKEEIEEIEKLTKLANNRKRRGVQKQRQSTTVMDDTIEQTLYTNKNNIQKIQ